MKKEIFFVAIATLAVTLASCRKERTCECKTNTTEVRTGNNPSTTAYTTTSKLTVAKQKKKEFTYTSNCFSTKTTNTFNGGGSGNNAYTIVSTDDTTCELK